MSSYHLLPSFIVLADFGIQVPRSTLCLVVKQLLQLFIKFFLRLVTYVIGGGVHLAESEFKHELKCALIILSLTEFHSSKCFLTSFFRVSPTLNYAPSGAVRISPALSRGRVRPSYVTFLLATKPRSRSKRYGSYDNAIARYNRALRKHAR